MKSIECPVCHNPIFSETFIENENFPCPYCEFKITVEIKNDKLQANAADIFQNLNWASSLFKNGNLILSQQKLYVLGDVFITMLGAKNWHTKTLSELEQELSECKKILRILEENNVDVPFLKLKSTLLDIYINSKFKKVSQNI